MERRSVFLAARRALWASLLVISASPRGAAAQEPASPPAAAGPERQPARELPTFKVGVETGLAYWCEHGPWGPENGVGHAMHPGFDGALRASVELTRWFAVDARLLLAYASAKRDVAGSVGFLTLGGLVAARFVLPLEHVRPYAIVGVGVYHTSVVGSGSTPLHGATAPGIPGGLGIEVPLPRRFSVGAEYVFHYQIGEKYSNIASIEGGDPVTANVFGQVAW
jgi:hypothetical protein